MERVVLALNKSGRYLAPIGEILGGGGASTYHDQLAWYLAALRIPPDWERRMVVSRGEGGSKCYRGVRRAFTLIRSMHICRLQTPPCLRHRPTTLEGLQGCASPRRRIGPPPHAYNVPCIHICALTPRYESWPMFRYPIQSDLPPVRRFEKRV